ncbi:hypothetical protein BMS3Abin02_01275 [bacterium BMS3Abin02]|nr:hypothetical protein BMS3Abin02_01275 [bacterium BMS3Abin02]GBE22503.1 hypothetical protein BMS3Bbin01_01878 [bacterium BMS3Bbin01]
MGLVMLLATATLIVLLGWWIRRRGRDVDDYFVRDFRDPPVFDAVDRLGGGKL